MLNDRTTFAPFILFEYNHDPGNYCLILTDSYMLQVGDAFEEHGVNGNGYGWTAVAQQAVRSYAPEIADRVEFDPEAGMLAVRGSDVEALMRLGALLRNAYHDRALLTELVRGLQPE